MAVYANTLNNSFHYDDLHMIVENPHIKDLANVLQFFSDPTTFSRDSEYAMYRPLVITTVAFNYAISGNNVQSYHVINILLHILCCFSVLGVLLKLDRLPSVALFGAIIFAVHPVCTEPVNYISSRSELLSALFVLSSFYCYQVYKIAKKDKYLYLSLICFSFGLLSKSIAITTIPLLVMYELYRHGNFRNLITKDVFKSLIPFGIVSVGYLMIVNEFVQKALVGDPVRSFSEQLGTQSKAIIYYAKLLGFPKGLSVHHQFFESSWDVTVLCSVLAIVSVTGVVFMIRQIDRTVLLGFGWVVVALSPTIVVPLHIMVNDHRMYLPLVGAIIFMSSFRFHATKNQKAIVLLLISALGVLVVQRNEIWTDEYTLWTDVANKSPTPLVPVAYVHLGNYAKEHGALKESIEYFQKAIDIAPEHVAARNNMANVYQQLDEDDKARSVYEKLLEDKPNLAEAHYNLGKVFQKTGEFEKALVQYSSVSSTNPHFAAALNNTGTVYELSGKIDSAVLSYRKALENDPDLSDALRNMERFKADWAVFGQTLMQSGQLVLVEKTSRELLRSFPRHKGALFLLSASLFVQREYSRSLKYNQELIALHPHFVEGYLQMGNLLETIGQIKKAINVYENILGMDYPKEFHELAKQRLNNINGPDRP